MPDSPVKTYELMLLIAPSLSEDDAKTKIQSLLDELIKANQGEVTFEDFWGRKTLAYPINKETAATYYVCQFSIDGDKLKGIDEELRLDNDVLRYLVTTVTTKVPPMTLEQIRAWNTEKLPAEQRGKKNEEKRAPRKGKHVDTRPEMQPVSSEDKPKPKAEDDTAKDKEKAAIDKSRLDEELNQMLEDI